MAVDAEELLLRMAALEEEAMEALDKRADAKPYFFHTQEAFPYFTNRLGDITVDSDSEEIDLYTYEIVVRLVIGHRTEGYTGETDSALQSYIPHLIQYFNERELLQSEVYPDAMDNLTRARVVSCRGYTEFVNSGVGGSQIGTEITLRAELEDEIEQAYY
jgi:hypothetical protein